MVWQTVHFAGDIVNIIQNIRGNKQIINSAGLFSWFVKVGITRIFRKNSPVDVNEIFFINNVIQNNFTSVFRMIIIKTIYN